MCCFRLQIQCHGAAVGNGSSERRSSQIIACIDCRAKNVTPIYSVFLLTNYPNYVRIWFRIGSRGAESPTGKTTPGHSHRLWHPPPPKRPTPMRPSSTSCPAQGPRRIRGLGGEELIDVSE